MKVKKVLLVEDFPALQKLIPKIVRSVFGEDIVVLVSGSLEEAERFYEEHVRDIDLILMDTHLGKGVTTCDLAKKISMEFNRPIVSISTDKNSREYMLGNGCTHGCEKSEIYEFLTKWKSEH